VKAADAAINAMAVHRVCLREKNIGQPPQLECPWEMRSTSSPAIRIGRGKARRGSNPNWLAAPGSAALKKGTPA
jgi:hypothetical protein